MPPVTAKSCFRKYRTIVVGFLLCTGSPDLFSQGYINGVGPPPEPSLAPHFNGTNLPTPPKQHTAWLPPVSKLPTNYISATRALFDAGLADPRGCEYREIEIPVASVPGAYPPRQPGAETGRVNTHGWVLPANNDQRFAVCWNGLVYPVLTVGTNADLRADVANLTTNGMLPSDTGILEAASVSHTSLLGIKGCLLLRLGEGDLARRYWQGRLLREKQPRWLWLRTPLTNSPARLDEIQLPETDPFPDWAIEWTWALFDRATFAHMRGDDGIALASARMLFPIQYIIQAEVEKRELKQLNEKYGKGSPNLPPPLRRDLFLTFLKDLPALLADQKRRFAKPRRQTVIATGIANYPNRQKRVAALIEDLDEISGHRRYGFGAWYGDKTVDALVSEGDDAVEPLLKCLERDEKKLTRSITVSTSRHTGVTRERQLHYVEEPITQILLGIMQTTCVGSWAATNELAAADTNKNRIAAAQMRAYWRKFKGVPLEERWYRILADDGSSEDSRRDAFDNIVSPLTSHSSLPNYPWTSIRAFSSSPPPLRGEPLRSKTNPSVTQLLVEYAMGQSAPVVDPINYGRIGRFHVPHWTGTALSLAKWDGRASIPVLQERMTKLLENWRACMAIPANPEIWQEIDTTSVILSENILQVTLARVKVGDESALGEYMDWLSKMPSLRYAKWQQEYQTRFNNPDLFKPLWRSPNHPAVKDIAIHIFNPSVSTLAPQLSLTNGEKSIVVQEAKTPLCALPQFQPLLLEALTDKSPLGSTSISSNGWQTIKTRYQNSGHQGAKPDLSLCDPGQTITFRTCDFIASQLARWKGMPKMELYWSEKVRDEAVQACFKQLQATNSSRAILELIPTPPNPHADPYAEKE